MTFVTLDPRCGRVGAGRYDVGAYVWGSPSGWPVAHLVALFHDGATDRFDPAPRKRVLLPAVVRQLRAFPVGVRLTFAPAATSARPQTDDETR